MTSINAEVLSRAEQERNRRADLFPVLLAALQGMLRAYGNCGSPAQQAAADTAKDAIAKATGSPMTAAITYRPFMGGFPILVYLDGRRVGMIERKPEGYSYRVGRERGPVFQTVDEVKRDIEGPST